MQTTLLIDPEAKLKIPLIKVPKDVMGNPYFIGKLQFPATMEFEQGVSFMVFTSDDGMEELQIAPTDPNRIVNRKKGLYINNGKFSIDIHPMIDANGLTYYVGEANDLSKLDLRQGIFFTIYTSISGQEQIQISRLQVKPRQRYDNNANYKQNTFDPKRYETV
jgi:hypothetical protein